MSNIFATNSSSIMGVFGGQAAILVSKRRLESDRSGTIRLVSTNPVCNSCGQVIEDFIEAVEAKGGKIDIEVVELRKPRR